MELEQVDIRDESYKASIHEIHRCGSKHGSRRKSGTLDPKVRSVRRCLE